MKRKFIYCISLLLVVLISFSSATIFTTYSTVNIDDTCKISTELKEKLSDLSDYETVEVAVWINNTDENVLENAYKVELQKLISRGIVTTDLATATLLFEENVTLDKDEVSAEKTQQLLSIRRSSFSDVITNANKEWQSEIQSVLSSQSKIIYTSTYAPIAIMKITKQDIELLKSLNSVNNIYLYDNEIVISDNCFDNVISKSAFINTDYGVWQEITGINDLRNMGYYGTDIRIGLYDQGSPELNHNSGVFNTSDLEEAYYDAPNPHSTYTASIIAGRTSNYLGVAPFSTLVYAGYRDSYLIDIDKMMSKNINVLCVSFFEHSGTYNNYGIYAKYMDYLSYNYHLTICISAGNLLDTPNGVTDVAMSYNAITVGNIDDNKTPSKLDDVVYDTCYNWTNAAAYKPDICAPGARAATASSPGVFSGGYGGTSAAAPIVAGICALLMDADSRLLVRPTLVKSVLMSSAYRFPNMDEAYSGSSSIYPGLSKEVGAGMVDGKRALELLNSNNWRCIEQQYALDSESPYTMNITVSQNDVNANKKIAICLVWRQKVINNSSVITATKYSLTLNNPNGVRVAYSNFQNDSKQFIYFKPTVAGTYKLIVQKENLATNTKLTFSYYISE